MIPKLLYLAPLALAYWAGVAGASHRSAAGARILMYHGVPRRDAGQIERQLRYSSRNGLNANEANSIERRLARLEQRISYEVRDGNRYAGRGSNNQWVDRDRDGRNDRREDDHGYRHD